MLRRSPRTDILITAGVASAMALVLIANSAPGSTVAKWANTSSKTAPALNYGQVGLLLTDQKTTMITSASLLNQKTFGIAYRPRQISVLVDPAVQTFTTQTEVNSFLNGTHGMSFEPSFANSLTSYAYGSSDCSGTTVWGITSSFSASVSTQIYSGDATSAIPLPVSSAAKYLCIQMQMGTFTNRQIYEWWSGREFRLAVQLQEQTAGNASWTKSEVWNARMVIPVPPPRAPNGTGGGNNDICVNTWASTVPEIRWRWPDQSSDNSTAISGVHHFGLWLRKTGTTTWTRIVGGGTANWANNLRMQDLWYNDELQAFTQNGDYQLKIVAYPFSDETKSAPSADLWNIHRVSNSQWLCGTVANSASLKVPNPDTSPTGYDGYSFPAFGDFL